jgi:RNA recognition motif-containing protein
MAGGNEEAKLFVAGLPDSVSEEVLKQIFETTDGKVVSVSLPKDRMTGRPRGFGFVTMSSPQEAQSARDSLDGSLQGGRSISVRPFQAEPPKRGEGGPMSSGPRSGGFGAGPPSRGPAGPGASAVGGGAPQAPDRTLYVGNLPYDCTQAELETLINGVAGEGAVARVHLPMDAATGRPRGFGFVTMSSSDTAKTASEQLKTAELKGRRLIVNIAHPKGERPPRAEGFAGGGGGFGGGGGGFGGGGGGGFGGPPAGAFGPPPASRKTFDSDRRRKGAGGEGGGEGATKGRGTRREKLAEKEDFDWRGALPDKDDE